MNTIAKHLVHATMIAATLAAGVIAQPAFADTHSVRVVQLQPVVVIAKRIRVVQLERVVVVAHRAAPPATIVAQRAARGAPVLVASGV